MGRGTSKLSGGAGGGAAAEIIQSPIATLQAAVADAQTRDLMGAYDLLKNKQLAKMSNEEKMVRAVVTDELAERGNLLYDPKTGNYAKYDKPQEIVYNDGKSYRISGIENRSVYNFATNSYSDKAFANAELYYNGKWAKVKNPDIEAALAVKYKQKRRS